MADRNRLYLALGSSWGGLQVVDISNPVAPVLTQLITFQGFVYDCVLDREEGDANLLFVAEGLRYHTYYVNDQSVSPVHQSADSVGGKVSRGLPFRI